MSWRELCASAAYDMHSQNSQDFFFDTRAFWSHTRATTRNGILTEREKQSIHTVKTNWTEPPKAPENIFGNLSPFPLIPLLAGRSTTVPYHSYIRSRANPPGLGTWLAVRLPSSFLLLHPNPGIWKDEACQVGYDSSLTHALLVLVRYCWLLGWSWVCSLVLYMGQQ